MTVSETRIEYMIEACAYMVGLHIDRFNVWEIKFLDSVENTNETGHLTDNQIDKLTEIFEAKCQ